MVHNEAQEQFNIDLMQSESLRSRMLGIVMFVVILAFSFSVYFNTEILDYSFPNRFYWYLGVIQMVLLAIRSFFLSRVLRIIYKRKKTIPLSVQLVNVFVEISIPSIVILFFALQNYPYHALMAPITHLYFIMIILTIMEMDMRISAFAGILAGLEFFLIAMYLISSQKPPEIIPLFGEPAFYFGRSLIMMISGLIAGYLAERIKRNAIKFYGQQLEKRKVEQLFGQQISPEIARRLISNPSINRPERHEACIMFLDIRNFTAMTERMSPENIIDFQNNIFPDMFQKINENKGIINQVMGDGFMATFGAPIPSENPCKEALNCCQVILRELKEKSFQGQFSEIKVGIGLHFGPVVTGNIGSALRKQFSITGQTVIIASRIEQLNKVLGTQILFSAEVVDHVAPDNYLDLGEHEIKGFKNPIRAYTLKVF